MFLKVFFCSLIVSILNDKILVFKYIIVGVATSIIYFSSMFYMSNNTLLNYEKIISISYVVAIVFHFTANRIFSFQATKSKISYQLTRYALVTLLNFYIQLYVAM